ncbi:MAG: hypothetical protein ACHRHE_12015 [Tepidisphaerales bacterium]
MIAGPNGSGKSTLWNYLRSEFSFPLGFCLNPDEIDHELEHSGQIDFGSWGLHVEPEELHKFMRGHPLAGRLADNSIMFQGNRLAVGPGVRRGYLAAILCDFMRQRWVAGGQSFTFETVMSNEDKVNLLKEARRRGFRAYLYYICTNSLLINRERVAVRVSQGGHDVPQEKIGVRYERSLSLLSLRKDDLYAFRRICPGGLSPTS